MDQTQDLSLTSLHEYTQLYGDTPTYVKEASQAETLNPENLSDASYADIINRKFPIHTKAACYISSLYFLENRESIAPESRKIISNRLAKAAMQHGITDDITDLALRSEDLKKQASYINPQDCMLPEEKRYPLRNSLEIKRAAEYLLQYKTWFPLETRIKMANKVLDKAAEFDIEFNPELDTDLQKQAGRGTYSPGEAVNQIAYRKILITNPEVKCALDKLAGIVDKSPELALDPESSRDIATFLDCLDRDWGIKYGNAIKAPEDFMFGGVFKTASAEIASQFGTASGSVYCKSQISSFDLDTVEDLFGEKCAADVASVVGVNAEKLAAHISSLPYMDAISFDWYMKKAGIDPVGAAPAPLGLSENQRQNLAMEYMAAM